jgi:hypothetical protein
MLSPNCLVANSTRAYYMGWRPTIVTEDFREFPQPLKTHTQIMPQIKQWPLHSNSSFINQLTTNPPDISRALLRVRVPRVEKQCSTPLTHKKINLLQETEDAKWKGLGNRENNDT